jgi:lipid-A-disaccharide synthase
VGLVPGSREEEIRNLLPVMLAAVARLKVRFPDIQCILPLATTIAPELVRSLIATAPFPVVIRSGPLPRLLAGCDVALVTSGTATLETAMAGVPMVVVYRVSEISYRVGRAVIRVPHIGLVNLVAQKEICPELIQGDANPERLAVEAEKILEKAEVRNRMTAELRRVADLLGGRGASGRTAEMALALMGEKREAKVGQQCSLVS